jgi:hypothetical protein
VCQFFGHYSIPHCPLTSCQADSEVAPLNSTWNDNNTTASSPPTQRRRQKFRQFMMAGTTTQILRMTNRALFRSRCRNCCLTHSISLLPQYLEDILVLPELTLPEHVLTSVTASLKRRHRNPITSKSSQDSKQSGRMSEGWCVCYSLYFQRAQLLMVAFSQVVDCTGRVSEADLSNGESPHGATIFKGEHRCIRHVPRLCLQHRLLCAKGHLTKWSYLRPRHCL